MTIEAFKRHINSVEEILTEEGPVPEETVESNLDLAGIDTVCKDGISLSFYEKVLPWLESDGSKRLFFIEDNPRRLKSFSLEPNAVALLNDPKVKVFYLETPLQKDAIAKKIGWLSAFKELLVVGPEWKSLIISYHEAAHAVASDAADFGVMVMSHLKANFKRKIRSLASLKGSMKNIPAIICGAGPSLEKNGHLLNQWKDKALIIAAGSAIQSMNVAPDLAIALDPHEPLVRKRFLDVPLCMQSRMHPGSWKSLKGEALYFPDSHFAFEPWLTASDNKFDAGFTAGTAGVAIAEHLGCNPIVLIGMDYCYQGKKKYAGQKGKTIESPLVEAIDAEGRQVWTQRDWLMAIRWLKTFASNGSSTYMNATEGGMEIGGFGPLREFPLSENVTSRFNDAITTAPFVNLDEERLEEWTQGLKESSDLVKERLLDPLWQIWAPLLERELMTDKEPLTPEEKMAIQKILLFEQVTHEHINA